MFSVLSMSGQGEDLVDLAGAGVTIDASSLVSGLTSVGDVHVDGASAIMGISGQFFPC